MMLVVFIDFKSAACLLAIDPIVGLADRYAVPIDWRAYSTSERDIPDSGADAAVIESHRLVREQSRRAVDELYANARGIELNHPPMPGSCDLALGALALIRSDRLPFIRAAFDAYWHGHADLNAAETVQSLIEQSGAECSSDLAQAARAFEEAQTAAEAAGVVEAPAILVEGQLFIGRQHLPWVEELLKGAAPPD